MTDEKGKNAIAADTLEWRESLASFYEEHRRRAEELNRPNPPNFVAICQHMAKRDFWTLKEGLNMLCRSRPESTSWENGIYNLWTLSKNCIGPKGTLKVTNPEASAWTDYGQVNKYRVRPADLLAWAQQKNISIPPELSEAVQKQRPLTVPVKTIAALQAKQGAVAVRQKALHEFLNETVRRASAAGEDFDINRIPVTKENFHSVFFRVNSTVSRVNPETLRDDVTELGGSFQHGTKDDSNNILEILFKEQK